MSVHPLSKTTLMRGMQCHKNLWLHVHRKDLEAAPDAATKLQFAEGNEVGELARKYYGPGDLIDVAHWEYENAHAATQELINSGAKTIFEAAFLVNGFYARADILSRDKDGWHMIEVKKAAHVKDYYFDDTAIQAHIVELTGLKLKSISIMHINNKVVYPELDELFVTRDITAEVRERQGSLADKLALFKKIVKVKAEPTVDIGQHCDSPFECPFKDHCWRGVPKQSVFTLPNLHAKKKWQLFHEGKSAIENLDAKKFKGNTKRAIEVTQSNKVFVDAKGIAGALKKWQWPLYFFDFETIGPAIPRYEGTIPYGQIPFQFSCHVWYTADSKKIEHFEYLHTESSDPRPGLIAAMFKGFGGEGSIVAYNQTFEIGVIKKLAEFDKKNKLALLSLTERFVDPLPIFRECVYHPDFSGHFGIKYVAPALIGKKLSYEGMAIGDGGTAQAWADQILAGRLKGEELDSVVADLLKYCRQDTMAMVELVKWLLRVSAH